MLKLDPDATWEAIDFAQPDGTITPCMYVGGQTAMVKTAVTIKGKTRTCLLPVMDHRNKAIQQPDAFAINTAIMRCMTKAISMHGLGLYIYAGEDLPQVEDPAIAARESELAQFALDLIGMHEAGKTLDACKAWKDQTAWHKDAAEANEERKRVWFMLKDYSALRSALKAN